MIPTLTADELQLVIERLASLGYEVVEADKLAINFTGSSVKSYILNQINHENIPDGLQKAFIDMVCGEFLNSKFSTNSLPDMNLDDALQSVNMGDVSVSYNQSMTPAVKFKVLVDTLITGRKDDLVCYRKIRW